MTCKDCKYFDTNKHPTFNGVVSVAGHCDKRVADGYDEYPMSDCDVCDMFEPTHESVGNVLDALDSWESVSK